MTPASTSANASRPYPAIRCSSTNRTKPESDTSAEGSSFSEMPLRILIPPASARLDIVAEPGQGVVPGSGGLRLVVALAGVIVERMVDARDTP